MNEPDIPLLTDVVGEPEDEPPREDRAADEPEISEPLDFAFDDSLFAIDENIVVFEADDSRRPAWSTHFSPPAVAPAEPELTSPDPPPELGALCEEELVWRIDDHEMEAIAAELQTRIASHTFELTDELMRAAFADFEARVFRQISTQLREQLPELIDAVVREHLLERSRESGEGD